MSSRTERYASADDDVRILLEKITDTVIPDTVVEYMIDIACDIIDSKLVYKYTVPFTTTPPLVRTIATHLSAYLVLRRIYSNTRGEGFADWLNMFKDFADNLLKSIFEGTCILIDSSGNELSIKSGYGIKISTSSYVPIFNEGGELDWEIDENKVDDAIKGR